MRKKQVKTKTKSVGGVGRGRLDAVLKSILPPPGVVNSKTLHAAPPPMPANDPDDIETNGIWRHRKTGVLFQVLEYNKTRDIISFSEVIRADINELPPPETSRIFRTDARTFVNLYFLDNLPF